MPETGKLWAGTGLQEEEDARLAAEEAAARAARQAALEAEMLATLCFLTPS